MKIRRLHQALYIFGLAGMMALAGFINQALAHCDTVNGPVIPEAQAALEKGDATPILKWVKPEHEAEIQKAFKHAVAVRAKGPEAKALADQYFLETLIRLHRQGEGASFTGIKDEPVEPIVALAEKALAAGSADGMLQALNEHMGKAIREKFDKVRAAGKHKDGSVDAGREYVEAYVVYMHFVEGIHNAMLADPGHHHAAMAGPTKKEKPAAANKH